MVQLNFDVVKEPRGFMKVLQFFFAILAFATTTSFSTFFTFHVTASCNGTLADPVRQVVSYPFRLDSVVQVKKICSDPIINAHFHFQTDTSSDAEFFVAIGVVCMLLSVAVLGGYSFYGDRYAESNVLPSADLILHGVLAFLWLAASAAWASGASTLKDGCNPPLWLDQVCANTNTNIDCAYLEGDSNGSFGKLNISLVFGFLNTFLWGANMWFIYKETPWFRGNQGSAPPAGDVGNI